MKNHSLYIFDAYFITNPALNTVGSIAALSVPLLIRPFSVICMKEQSC